MKFNEFAHSTHQITLDEVDMSPSALGAFFRTPAAQAMKAGFEMEMIVPDMAEGGDTAEPELDYSNNPRAYDIEDILEFFSETLNARSSMALSDKLENDYMEYIEDVVNSEFDNNDRGVDAVREMAKNDDMTENDIESMINNKNGRWDHYYNEVIEQIREDSINEIGFVDFLRRSQINTMSDVCTDYNLDWPLWTTPEESDDSINDLSQLSKEISSVVGMKVFYSDDYHSVPRGEDNWVLEPDSSIKAEPREGEAGLELVSPPMNISKAIEMITKTFSWAKDYGCRTDRSTGFHMGVSLPSQSTKDLDWVKLTLFLGDQHVLEKFSRSAQTYAVSSLSLLQKTAASSATLDVAAAMDAMRKGLTKLAAQEIGAPTGGKYVSVHVKENYVEFRSAGGDYLDKEQEITLTLMRYVRAMAIASDPNAYKKEYATKLYKLMSSQSKDVNNNSIELFVKYSTGIIDKQTLKQAISSGRWSRFGKAAKAEADLDKQV